MTAGQIEEMNAPKACSGALAHPTWDELLSLLPLYGVKGMERVGLIDTSHDGADIRWNYIVDHKYVLRLTNAPEMTEARLHDLNRLITRYGEFGLACPAFLLGTDGLFFHSWGELTVYLSEYVDLPVGSEAGLSETEKDALADLEVVALQRIGDGLHRQAAQTQVGGAVVVHQGPDGGAHLIAVAGAQDRHSGDGTHDG